MRQFASSFVPSDGFNSEWLRGVYELYVTRSRSVGKDGVRPRSFRENLEEECDLIVRKVAVGSYVFTSYREKLIARGANRKPRQISIPTIRDRLALRGALQFLKYHFAGSQPKPPHQFIKDIKLHLGNVREHSSFLRMDIRDFYPSLRHDFIENGLRKSEIPASVIDLIMRAVTTPTGSRSQVRPGIGVPQGLSISNALAAIYMAEFDKDASALGFYRRYVDDIIVIADSEKIVSIYLKLHNLLQSYELSSHPMGTAGKTEINRVDNGVQYLGYEISKSGTSIRSSSVAKMFTNIAKVLTCLRYRKSIDRHIFRLNLKITGCVINNARRGWLMFFSQTENVSQLSHLDAWLQNAVKEFDFDKGKIKTFKKSYYEIRYNLKQSFYIPNFNNYSINQKKEVVAILLERPLEAVDAFDVEFIESEFNRLIGREITELERDLVEAFS